MQELGALGLLTKLAQNLAVVEKDKKQERAKMALVVRVSTQQRLIATLIHAQVGVYLA